MELLCLEKKEKALAEEAEKVSTNDDSSTQSSSKQEMEDVRKKNNGKEEETKEKETPPPVLEPDHPLMQKFQIALKNHLLRQIDKVSAQVSEFKEEMRMREKEKEEVGIKLYSAQQEVFRQQKVLEDCEKAIEDLVKEREVVDTSNMNKKLSWKEEVDQLNCAKKKEMNLLNELRKLSSIEKQMEKWEQEMHSELSVSQRISHKTAIDKNKLIEEKRNMDMFLLKLMTAVTGFESEIKILDAEIENKMDEKDSMNQTLADSAADLQALITEHKRLVGAWNGVAVMISQKNNVYTALCKDLKKNQDSFQSLNAEIESFKRSAIEETKKGEKLVLINTRLQNESDIAKNSLKSLVQKKSSLEDRIANTSKIIERTEADLFIVRAEKEKIQGDLILLKGKCDKYHQEHKRYEDEAMGYVHHIILNDKSASHLSKRLKETRIQNREKEFQMLEVENKISQKFLEIEELKAIIARNNEIVEEGNREIALKEDELKHLEEEIQKCHSSIIQKQANYALLNRKLEKQIEKTNFGKIWQSPSQVRINDLEKTNAEIQAKNDKMQSFWLIQQNNNVKLSNQRSEQIKEISLLRKQCLLFEQRALKTKREVEKEYKIENEVNKTISQLQHKLSTLNEQMIGRKDYKENLGKENALTQAHFVQNLKESELEQIRLKDEIKELEASLEELAENMLSTQREMLAWERKIKYAIETKSKVSQAKSCAGDLGQMKMEIHRMEVRYGQLKKVQDKLITDLEQSVSRRDAILDGVEAKEKRLPRGANTRVAMQKKLDALKLSIRSIKNDRKDIQRAINNTQEAHEDLRNSIKEKENRINEMNEATKKMDLQLENGRLQKCQNLEMLVRRQKKCKMYERLKEGKLRMLFKNEKVLENEFQKARSTNSDLILVMEALIQDFPNYKFFLKKIQNTFEAKPS